MSQFKVGEYAVYPGHGVGLIEGVEEKSFSGTSVSFYNIKIVDTGMILMVPLTKVQDVGLRGIIPEKDVKRIYKILQERRPALDNQTWNRRYREYMEKIKTGSVYEIAGVLRDLFLLRTDKDLSFGEKKMLDTAKNLLVKEISLAKGTEEESIEQELLSIMGV